LRVWEKIVLTVVNLCYYSFYPLLLLLYVPGIPSSYLDNSTITLLLTEKVEETNVWEVIDSTESNHHINDIVIDERWETFKNNHDFHTEFDEILKNRSLSYWNINFSHRHNGTENGTQNQVQKYLFLELENYKKIKLQERIFYFIIIRANFFND
jgi:hypothetical protein